MKWEPTARKSIRINAIKRSLANVNEYSSKHPEDWVLKEKRVKWVEKSEIDKRRIEKGCFRFGRNNCRIDLYLLAAVIPLVYQTKNTLLISRTKVTKAAIKYKATNLWDQ
jgi:hypothetical protein